MISPRSLCWAAKYFWERWVTTYSIPAPTRVGTTATSASLQSVYTIMMNEPAIMHTATTVVLKLSAHPVLTVSVSLVMRLIRSPILCPSRKETGSLSNFLDRSLRILSPTLSDAAEMTRFSITERTKLSAYTRTSRNPMPAM